jgi:uncharacterized protein (DUF433 family)
MDSDRIVADPDIMAGAPTIRGTRITVAAVLGMLATGADTEQVLADYPSFTRDDVLASLAFAAGSAPREYAPAVGCITSETNFATVLDHAPDTSLQ